jgi:hypothetical protein
VNELFVMTMWAANTAHSVFSVRLAPLMHTFRKGLLPITLLLIGFAPFSQAHSMPAPILSGAAARDPVRAAEILRDGISLDEAVRRAEAQYRARVVRTEVQDEDGRKVYVLKLLSEDGRVINVRIDAATGRTR